MTNPLFKTALLGILTAPLAVIIEQLAAVPAQFFLNEEVVFLFYDKITWFLFLAVVIEEGLKYSFLRHAIWNRFGIYGKKFIAAGFLFGTFFGLTEIGLIIFSSPETKILAQNFERETMTNLLSIVLVQTATALLISSLIATQEKLKKSSFLKILILPILIHLLYNFLIIQKGNYTDLLVLVTLIISYLTSFTILAFNFRKLA